MVKSVILCRLSDRNNKRILFCHVKTHNGQFFRQQVFLKLFNCLQLQIQNETNVTVNHLKKVQIRTLARINSVNNSSVSSWSYSTRREKTCCILLDLYMWSLRPAILLKGDSGTGVFLWILRNFSEHLFNRTHPDDCFCI